MKRGMNLGWKGFSLFSGCWYDAFLGIGVGM
jgi:hypothetical protein